VTAVSPIRRRTPVEEYLKLQRRYAHLFGQTPRPDIVARLQEIADENIARYGLITNDSEDSVSTGVTA
jgi:pyruvate ferredoxin oxidoreductase beta subunit